MNSESQRKGVRIKAKTSMLSIKFSSFGGSIRKLHSLGWKSKIFTAFVHFIYINRSNETVAFMGCIHKVDFVCVSVFLFHFSFVCTAKDLTCLGRNFKRIDWHKSGFGFSWKNYAKHVCFYFLLCLCVCESAFILLFFPLYLAWFVYCCCRVRFFFCVFEFHFILFRFIFTKLPACYEFNEENSAVFRVFHR